MKSTEEGYGSSPPSGHKPIDMALAVLHAAMGFAPTREGYTLLTPEGYVARGWASWEEVNEAGPETWPTGPPADIPCIKLFTFDFDGTTEFTDNLAHAVFDHATEEEKLTDLVPAYERLKAELGGTAAIILAYFDGPGRIEYFRKYVDELIGQESHVFILSASWDPTPGTVWEAYLYHVRAATCSPASRAARGTPPPTHPPTPTGAQGCRHPVSAGSNRRNGRSRARHRSRQGEPGHASCQDAGGTQCAGDAHR